MSNEHENNSDQSHTDQVPPRPADVTRSESVTPPPEAQGAVGGYVPAQTPAQVHAAAQARPEPGWASTSGAGVAGLSEFDDSGSVPQKVLRSAAAEVSMASAWRWAVATLFVFPLLGFWALPEAARATLAATRGDDETAREHARTARVLGLAAIAIGVVLFILFMVLVIVGAATADDTVTQVPRYSTGGY